jgi:nitrite reductase/ring-hydroxylating ferredoxin subunit
MLETGWYAAGLAEGGSAPRAVGLGGETFALARLDGVWAAWSDRCPHRLAPLSAGVVVGEPGSERLQCAYHGWRFDSSGRCSLIPALGVDSAIPARAHSAQSAQGCESGGTVWLPWGVPATAAPTVAGPSVELGDVAVPLARVFGLLGAAGLALPVAGAPTTVSDGRGGWAAVTPLGAGQIRVHAGGPAGVGPVRRALDATLPVSTG